MELIELTRITIEVMCRAINLVTSTKYYLIDRFKFRNNIKKNTKLNDIHSKETIYIVGNGPSIKNLDLSLLKGKTVMTVNKTVKTPLFDQLHPSYHCIIDRYELEKVIEDVQNKLNDTSCQTKFILHRSGISRVGNYERAYYVYNRSFPVGNKLKDNLGSNASTFYNVLPFAAMTAIYMGFNRIVLLGNDFSFFTSRKDQHYYDVDEQLDRSESLYQDLQGCAIVLLQYRTLRKYCESKNIEIVNATEGSLLDEIKQVKLKDYL